ncbi:formate C-acetyltransferase/glycerol dehydratase family glycyl radical enzyme [uncultured Selenomonas sp.]|uniref:glycyl radical protein n=1 Tax=uncultured Selenomonas sp. TaxID=159275 RepID=UPI0025CD7048|nr:formate C-acetyltransferase/glycerol dehydratase family glycyl radical enzyme [uncultured Selenomonas sp.]
MMNEAEKTVSLSAKAIDELPMPERIGRLRDAMLAEPRFVSIEQARIVTRVYQEHAGEPRILVRAQALAAALREMAIRVTPGELIVGNRTAGVRAGVVFPESGSRWVDREFEDLPTRPQDRFQVHEEDIREFRDEILPYWEGRSLEDVLRSRAGKEVDAIARVVKINQKDHAQGHICPDCRRWLAKGPVGLRAEAEEKAAQAAGDAKNFYQAVAIVMEGVQVFLRRYAGRLRTMAKAAPPSDELRAKAGKGSMEPAAAPEPASREELLECARICTDLSDRPAESFHEAVQALWFLFVVLQMESNASSFSPGRLDEILAPYYERSRAAGMTQARALEILECLWLKFNQIVYLRNRGSAKYFAGFPIGFNVAVGGVDAAGDDYVNDVSFLCLQAQAHLGLPQPNLSVRLHPKTGDALLKKAIRVVAKGSGMPQFFNDKAVIPAFEELGFGTQEARDYAIVGCVELTTQGNNLGWSDAAMFNLCKALELALNGGKDLITGEQVSPDFGNLAEYETFADVEQALAKEIDFFMERMIAACAEVERAHIELLPTPFLSSVIDGCMEKGVDVTAGGAEHNLSGIQMIQVANLADSLAALKALVYDEKIVPRGTFLDALRKNYEGYELLRTRILNKVPKYGNDVDWVDALGVQWARYFRKAISKYRNYRGGPFHTGMYTVSAHVPMGANVGASPDGRKSGQPLADGGMSPVYGRDEGGPTAVLKSVSKLDKELTTNGGLLNMKFLPEFFATETGVDKFAQFLRTFVDLEIPHIQFNVVRREDLLDAKAHPENHRSLTVRVAGYTAYFTELAEDLQDEIIARTSYAGV